MKVLSSLRGFTNSRFEDPVTDIGHFDDEVFPPLDGLIGDPSENVIFWRRFLRV